MDQLDDWLQKISEGIIDRALQYEITDKLLELLEQKKASLGTREKILFSQAVTALSTSLSSTYQPNEAGLKRCLLILQKVVNPENETDETDGSVNEAAEVAFWSSSVKTDETDETYSQRHEAKQVSYAMLVTTVKMIRGEIAKNW